MTEKTRNEQASKSEGRTTKYHFHLFVAGDEINSATAKVSLERICSKDLEGDCQIEIIDILRDSRRALAEGILVTPALLITGPGLRTVVLGNLADTERVRAALQLGSEKQ